MGRCCHLPICLSRLSLTSLWRGYRCRGCCRCIFLRLDFLLCRCFLYRAGHFLAIFFCIFNDYLVACCKFGYFVYIKCHFTLVIFCDERFCFCICTHKVTLKLLGFWGFFFCFCFCSVAGAGAAAGASFLGSTFFSWANTVVTKATLIRTANTINKAFFIM